MHSFLIPINIYVTIVIVHSHPPCRALSSSDVKTAICCSLKFRINFLICIVCKHCQWSNAPNHSKLIQILFNTNALDCITLNFLSRALAILASHPTQHIRMGTVITEHLLTTQNKLFWIVTLWLKLDQQFVCPQNSIAKNLSLLTFIDLIASSV